MGQGGVIELWTIKHFPLNEFRNKDSSNDAFWESLPTDTYYYVVKADENTFKGPIYILR